MLRVYEVKHRQEKIIVTIQQHHSLVPPTTKEIFIYIYKTSHVDSMFLEVQYTESTSKKNDFLLHNFYNEAETIILAKHMLIANK